MAAIFVVGLPAAEGRVLADGSASSRVMRAAFLAIAEMAKSHSAGASRSPCGGRAVSTASMSGCLSTIQRGGVAVGVPKMTLRPCRPSTSMARMSQSNVQVARRRLQPGPGELADADILDADLGHARRIALPPVLGPVFGIVADAEGRDGHDEISELDEGFGLAGNIDVDGKEAAGMLFGGKLLGAQVLGCGGDEQRLEVRCRQRRGR